MNPMPVLLSLNNTSLQNIIKNLIILMDIKSFFQR